MIFSLWTTDELKAAIRSIEEQLIPGVASISFSGGGFVSHNAPADAKENLALLYRQLGTRPGYKHLAAQGQMRTVYIRHEG